METIIESKFLMQCMQEVHNINAQRPVDSLKPSCFV